MTGTESLLCSLLDCGVMDLRILDDVGYDLGEIVDCLRCEGIAPTLNAITDEIFRKGQLELTGAVAEAIKRRKEAQDEMDEAEVPDPDPDTGEYERYVRLQKEIDELEMLNPEEDMGWYCNCLDTSCWLDEHESIYQKYLADEISDIEDNMGFSF